MNSLFDIKNKVIVITGGTGAIGASLTEYFLKNGAKVAIIATKEKVIAEQVGSLKTQYEHILGFACSVLDQSQIQTINDQILDKWSKIDVLINGAGGNMPGATIADDKNFFDLNMSDFRKVAELNLDGSVIPALVFGKTMSVQGYGNIINISSMAADKAITRVIGYSTSKAAIDIFTKWLATEMALKFDGNIRVNAIAPGFFIGNQNRKLLLNEDGSCTERGLKIIKNTPMKRFGDVSEIHGTVHWLISEAANFVTGTVIPIDGGFSAFSGV